MDASLENSAVICVSACLHFWLISTTGFLAGGLVCRAKGRNFNGNVIVDRAANVFAHAASYTTFTRHHKPLGIKIHGQRIRGTFRHTGMAALSCRAEPMVHDRDSHTDILSSGDRQQCFCRTGGDARHVIAEIARNLVGENHWGAFRMQHERIMRAGFDAVAALRAPLEEQCFVDRSGRTEPIRPHGRRRLRSRRIRMRGIFLRRFRDRQDGILEKVPPAVFRIYCHLKSQISNLKYATNSK